MPGSADQVWAGDEASLVCRIARSLEGKRLALMLGVQYIKGAILVFD